MAKPVIGIIGNAHLINDEYPVQAVGVSNIEAVAEAFPLLVAGRRAGRRFLALGFNPRDSDFVLRVAWPLFVLNVMTAPPSRRPLAGVEAASR